MIALGQMLLNMQKANVMSDKLSPISHGDGSIVGEVGQQDHESARFYRILFSLLLFDFYLNIFLDVQPFNLYLRDIERDPANYKYYPVMFPAAEEIHLLNSHTTTASFSNKIRTFVTDKETY